MDKTYQFNDVYYYLDNVTLSLSSFNESESFSRSSFENYFITTVLSLLFVFTAFFNLSTFAALVCFHKARKVREKPLDVLVLNLVIADLVLLVPMGFSLYSAVNDLRTTPDSDWPFCRFVCGLDLTVLLVIVFLKAVFHAKRYKDIVDGFACPGEGLKTGTAWVLAAVCWGLGVVSLLFIALSTGLFRMEYSYCDITCIVAADIDACWVMVLHLGLTSLGVIAVFSYTIRFMGVIIRIRSPPVPAKQNKTPPSAKTGDSATVFTIETAVPSTSDYLNDRPVTRLHAKTLAQQSPGTSPPLATTSQSQSQQSSPLRVGEGGGSELKKRRTQQMSRSQSDPVAPYQDSTPGGETLVAKAESPEAEAPKRGENPNEEMLENNPPQARARTESRRKLWVILTSVLLTCLVCFGVQWTINACRYMHVHGPYLDALYRRAYVGKLLFYLTGVTNPMLYALYRKSLFEIRPSCGCWYCRFAAWLQRTTRNVLTFVQDRINLF